jgi:predicted RNA binding protein YcfA (HicA-like mRNA interferase family)
MKTRGWSPKELIPLILGLGYEMTNGKGAHKKFTHPQTQHSFTISAKPNMDRYDSKLVKTLRHVWDLQHGIKLEPVKIENATPLNLLQSCGLLSRLPSGSASPLPASKEPEMTRTPAAPPTPTPVPVTSNVPAIGKMKWFEWLVAVRKNAKIGTRDGAELMGWSTFTLSMVERGARKLSQEEYNAFCLIYDVNNPPAIALEKDPTTLRHRASIKASMDVRFPKKVKAVPEQPPVMEPTMDVCTPPDYCCRERKHTGDCACEIGHDLSGFPPLEDKDFVKKDDDVVAQLVSEYKELKDLVTRAKAAEPRFEDLQKAIRVISSLFPGRVDPFVVADVKADDAHC